MGKFWLLWTWSPLTSEEGINFVMPLRGYFCNSEELYTLPTFKCEEKRKKIKKRKKLWYGKVKDHIPSSLSLVLFCFPSCYSCCTTFPFLYCYYWKQKLAGKGTVAVNLQRWKRFFLPTTFPVSFSCFAVTEGGKVTNCNGKLRLENFHFCTCYFFPPPPPD